MSDSDSRVFYCKLCEQSWSHLPEDAVQLQKGSGPGYTMYRFADGSVHSIRSIIRKGEKNEGLL